MSEAPKRLIINCAALCCFVLCLETALLSADNESQSRIINMNRKDITGQSDPAAMYKKFIKAIETKDYQMFEETTLFLPEMKKAFVADFRFACALYDLYQSIIERYGKDGWSKFNSYEDETIKVKSSNTIPIAHTLDSFEPTFKIDDDRAILYVNSERVGTRAIKHGNFWFFTRVEGDLLTWSNISQVQRKRLKETMDRHSLGMDNLTARILAVISILDTDDDVTIQYLKRTEEKKNKEIYHMDTEKVSKLVEKWWASCKKPSENKKQKKGKEGISKTKSTSKKPRAE